MDLEDRWLTLADLHRLTGAARRAIRQTGVRVEKRWTRTGRVLRPWLPEQQTWGPPGRSWERQACTRLSWIYATEPGWLWPVTRGALLSIREPRLTPSYGDEELSRAKEVATMLDSMTPAELAKMF